MLMFFIPNGKTGKLFRKRLSVSLIVFLFVLVICLPRGAVLSNLARLAVLKLYFQEPAIDRNIISQKAISVGDDRLAGIIHYNAGDYSNVEPLLLSAIWHHPDDPTAHFFLGNTFYEMGNLENALVEWRLADASGVADTFVLRASQADFDGDDARLVEYARIAIDLDPKNGQAFYLLGRWHYKQKALQEALSSYYKAESLAKENELLAKVYRGIGFVYSAAEEHSQAASYIERAVRYLPNNRRYYYYLDLASEYGYLGMYDKALLYIDDAMNINRLDPGSYIRKGDIYALQEEKDKATYWYGMAIEVDPTSGRGEYALGKYLLGNGDYFNAVVYIKRAIDLGWDWNWVRFDLGRAYKGLEKNK